MKAIADWLACLIFDHSPAYHGSFDHKGRVILSATICTQCGKRLD